MVVVHAVAVTTGLVRASVLHCDVSSPLSYEMKNYSLGEKAVVRVLLSVLIV